MILRNTNAKVHINSDIITDGEKMTMEMVSDAKYSCRCGKHYIMYNEDLTGTGQDSVTTVKVDGEDVYIKRSGAISSYMTYQKGRSNTCLYQFDYGKIVIENFTHEVYMELDKHGGWINLHYDLDMGGKKSDNHMRISVTDVMAFECENYTL